MPTEIIGEGNITSILDVKEKKVFALNKAQYGDKIRERRIACGLNQPQLATILNVTKNTISNWEAGRSRPDLNQLPLLCRTLNTTVAWFVGASDQLSDLTGHERQHIANYRLLSKYNKQAIDGLIEAMIDIADKELRERCENGFARLRRNENKSAAGPHGYDLDSDRPGEYVYVRTSRNAYLADEIITVSGDSMEPTYYDGDDLLVEYAETPKRGEVGIFIADGTGYVKEYREDGLYSHNPAYPVLRFTDDDNVRYVGRVLGVVTPDQYPTRAELEVLEDLRREQLSKK